MLPVKNISSNATYRGQLLGAFLSCFKDAFQSEFKEGKPWFMSLLDLPTPTRALETSTLAVCAAKLGRLNNDQNLVAESLGLYTLGLRELQRALWDRNAMYSDETLGACMALATYELIECPGGDKLGFASHHTGCSTLVQSRGANAHVSGLGHQIFLIYRFHGVRSHFTTPPESAWVLAH
jgi:Fungal specific transcription factor domain